MGRKAYFKNEEFLNAAVQIIAEDGLNALTIAALARRIKAPVGSVYHRFPSRDTLLAEVWLNIIESFQKEFIEKLQIDGLEATLSCLEWVRRHPLEARIMLLYRMQDLMSGQWPEGMRERAQCLNKNLRDAVIAFIRKKFGRVTRENTERVTFALYDAPIGIIRRHLLENRIPPPSAARLIRETYDVIIEKAK